MTKAYITKIEHTLGSANYSTITVHIPKCAMEYELADEVEFKLIERHGKSLHPTTNGYKVRLFHKLSQIANKLKFWKVRNFL